MAAKREVVMKLIIIVLAMLIVSCGKIEGAKVQEAIAVCEKIEKDWRLMWNGGEGFIICEGDVKIKLK